MWQYWDIQETATRRERQQRRLYCDQYCVTIEQIKYPPLCCSALSLYTQTRLWDTGRCEGPYLGRKSQSKIFQFLRFCYKKVHEKFIAFSIFLTPRYAGWIRPKNILKKVKLADSSKKTSRRGKKMRRDSDVHKRHTTPILPTYALTNQEKLVWWHFVLIGDKMVDSIAHHVHTRTYAHREEKRRQRHHERLSPANGETQKKQLKWWFYTKVQLFAMCICDKVKTA